MRLRADRMPFLMACLAAACLSVAAGEQNAISSDVTQGTLRIAQKDGGVVECPLKHTNVEAEISGFVARVHVTQTFYNPLDEKIEAVYVFPLPHESAVDQMTMIIGQRSIVGLIKRRAEARQVYEYALKTGKTAALLEQERPNIFTQSVGNIPPKQEVKVEITYLDVLKYDSGSYEFHFPMVVGPRYNPAGYQGGIGGVPHSAAGASGQQVELSYLKPGERNGHDIALNVWLNAGVPIQNLKVTNHKAEVVKVGTNRANVRLSNHDSVPNKDFVVRYDVLGSKPEMALLTHSDGSVGYFMLMVQPKADEQLKKSPPREMVFLVDVSGSMSGAPTEKNKELMSALLKRCKSEDTVQVITFESMSRKLFEKALPVNEESIGKALSFTQGLRGGGGTEMLKGIQMAISEPLDGKRMRMVVMLTDGYIGNEPQIIEAVGKGCGDQIRFWCVGIGTSVNRFLVDGVAKQGGGMGKVLGLNEDAEPLAGEIMERIQRAQLSQVKIAWGDVNVYDTYPARIPELWAGRPIMVYGLYYAGDGKTKTTLTVSGQVEGEPVSWPLQVDFAEGAEKNEALGKVWARQKIEDLMQQTYYKGSPEVGEAVTLIALEHSLMSQYTSFVAVDEAEVGQLKTPAKRPRRMLVPVPIPEGTQYSGFFGNAGGDVQATVLNALSQQTYYRYSSLPTSGEASDIVVPPDILAKAELGDHFETINPDRPDAQGAFGRLTAWAPHATQGTGGTAGTGLEDLIGIGGAVAPGSGGGWGGGNGTGSFGVRYGGGRRLMVKRHGGSRATESSADSGLGWLARHQETDGHWDAKKCNATDTSDTVSTSFALLAFLGAGHTEKVGQYKENVTRSVAWLKTRQAADGSITDASDTTNPKVTVPPQAIAALALAEAAGMANMPDTKAAAQKAIDYCANVHQEGTAYNKGGWGFKAGDPGDLHASIWFIMALKSAKVAGLTVAAATFDGAITFLDTIEHKLGEETDKGYGPASVYWRAKAVEEPQKAHVLTAMGTLARQFLGWKKEDLTANAEWFVSQGGVPAWEQADPLYWYFGTLCVFQQGGELWKRWNEPMKQMLAANQSKSGGDAGSWNTLWGGMTGTLCLEAYYRYLLISPAK